MFPEYLRLRDSSCLREASSTFLDFFLNQTGPEMTMKKEKTKDKTDTCEYTLA
jgi:hypothetical protein